MKIFSNVAAQGDLMIRKVAETPKETVKVPPTNGRYVLAHSETGHDHVVDAKDVDLFRYEGADNDMKSYLVVKGIIGAQLEHLRTFDTHETLLIPPGIYEIRRQREYVPEGWRKVED
jgi:hypothetical protein